MNKKEIKDYLKRADELGAKLTGEDKETYTWLIYGYNHCAKLLNKTEQQCKKQKEVIDKAIMYINLNKQKTICAYGDNEDDDFEIELWEEDIDKLLDILKEVSE